MAHPVLNEILTSAKAHQQRGSRLLAVFDLDSTLFDVSHRIEHILKLFASLAETKKRWPVEAEKLSQIQAHPKEWGIKTALQRLGLAHSPPEFFHAARDFWGEHFFSNHHLHIDQPYPGAVEYLNELKSAGAHIQYLTGRDVHRMGHGSLESLRQWSFPVEKDDLILKPHQSHDDAEFKRDVLKLKEGHHPEIWFFENEPVIINMVLADCPHVDIVFMDSVHSGREEAPEHLHRLPMRFK